MQSYQFVCGRSSPQAFHKWSGRHKPTLRPSFTFQFEIKTCFVLAVGCKYVEMLIVIRHADHAPPTPTTHLHLRVARSFNLRTARRAQLEASARLHVTLRHHAYDFSGLDVVLAEKSTSDFRQKQINLWKKKTPKTEIARQQSCVGWLEQAACGTRLDLTRIF